MATRRGPEAHSPTGCRCDVPGADWYGNARAIFTGGRVLALVSSELTEGVPENGAVKEVRRIDLTAPLD